MKRFDLGRPSAATDREEKMGVETGGVRGRGWRKVINNLWMESNKRLGEGQCGKGLFVGLQSRLILRWLARANVQSAAEKMKSKRAHTHTQTYWRSKTQ